MGYISDVACKETIELRKSLYIKDPAEFYGKSYFIKRPKMRDWEMKAGEILSNLFNIESMIDFGCGLGSYLEGALNGKTKRVLGIDVCYDNLIEYVPKKMKDFIVKGNAGKELDHGRWDCALSIETAEHLLPEEEDIFIMNLVNASSRLIVLTAAYSYNYFHLNPGKTKEYWVQKLIDAGCKELINEEKKLSQAWKGSAKKHIRKKVIVAEI
jgi:2-polyprenyl-3-methyl-5-hydroxy-6-metoxy-1,4-benzoquinol methylase